MNFATLNRFTPLLRESRTLRHVPALLSRCPIFSTGISSSGQLWTAREIIIRFEPRAGTRSGETVPPGGCGPDLRATQPARRITASNRWSTIWLWIMWRKKQETCYVDYDDETLRHLDDSLAPSPTYPDQHWTTRGS